MVNFQVRIVRDIVTVVYQFISLVLPKEPTLGGLNAVSNKFEQEVKSTFYTGQVKSSLIKHVFVGVNGILLV